MLDKNTKKPLGNPGSPLRLLSPLGPLNQLGPLGCKSPFNSLHYRYLISSDIKILRPKTNAFLNSNKSNTQRNYIKKTQLKIRAKVSQTVQNPPKMSERSRLVVVGSKEKIESPSQVRSYLKAPISATNRNHSSRPCTCSPNKFQRQSRETLTIKIPNHPAEGDSDRDSNYCNYYVENRHIFNYEN